MDGLPGHEMMLQTRSAAGGPITERQICSICCEYGTDGYSTIIRSLDWPCPSVRLAEVTERAERAEGGVDGLATSLESLIDLLHGIRHNPHDSVASCPEHLCRMGEELIKAAMYVLEDGLAADLTEAALSGSEQPA